jgi:hypothetical protein
MGEFVSLTETLTAEDFEKSFGDLSPDKQDLIRRRLPAAPDADRGSLPGSFAAPVRRWAARGPATLVSAWNTFSVEQRRAFVGPSDWQRDPANEQVQQKTWDLQSEIDQDIASTKRDISELEDLTPSAMRHTAATRAQMLRDHRQNLYELREQERELLEAKPAELHSVLERLTRVRRSSGLAVDQTPIAESPAADGADQNTNGSHAITPVLVTATEALIHKAICAIYDHAAAKGMKPPNIKQIGNFGQELLRRCGRRAGVSQIQRLAQDPRYKGRRLKPGARVYGTFLPFSLEEM